MSQGRGGTRSCPDIANTDVAHPARVYDYWLGGKDNFPATAPWPSRSSKQSRTCAGWRPRTAPSSPGGPLPGGKAGIRQFLDIGTGIPTSPNVHEVAQAVAPERGSSTWTTTRSSWPTPAPC